MTARTAAINRALLAAVCQASGITLDADTAQAVGELADADLVTRLTLAAAIRRAHRTRTRPAPEVHPYPDVPGDAA